MLHSLILLSGFPASGKSHFGEWLKLNRGYLHIDAELPDGFGSRGLKHLWDCGINSCDFTQFASAIGRPAVVNWGFPVTYISQVRGIVQAGFVPIWLNATDAAARIAYARRGTGYPSALETQLQGIKSGWQSIHDVFAPRIFLAIEDSGVHIPPESLCKNIEELI